MIESNAPSCDRGRAGHVPTKNGFNPQKYENKVPVCGALTHEEKKYIANYCEGLRDKINVSSFHVIGHKIMYAFVLAAKLLVGLVCVYVIVDVCMYLHLYCMFVV